MKFLALVLMVFSFSQSWCNSLTWDSAIQLSGMGVSASDPKVVIDTSGNVTAAWIESGLVMSATRPQGMSWGSTTPISSGGSASSPTLKMDSSGNIVAIWLESGVVTSATLPSGGSWSALTPVSDMGGGASFPVLAVDTSTGNAVAAWVRAGLMETATFTLLSSSWGLVTSFIGYVNSDNPSVAIGHSQVLIAWHSIPSTPGAQDQILVTTAATVGGSWSTAANLVTSTFSTNHNYPSASLDSNGNAQVVWYRSQFGGDFNRDYINVRVVQSTLPSGGSSWSDVLPVSDPDYMNPVNFQLNSGFDGKGNAFVLFGQSVDGSTFDIGSSVQLSGSSNQITSFVASQNLYAYQGDFSINSLGEALVGWMEYDGANVGVQTSETNLGGFQETFYTIPQTLSTGTDNGYPRVALSANNNMGTWTAYGAAVWIQNDGTNNIIQSAIGSKTVVGSPTMPTVAQSPNDFGIFTEYYNTLNWTLSTDPTVIGYIIFRDGIAIASVDASTVQFIDHNQINGGSVTYGIAAFDSDLSQSETVTASL